MAVTWDPAEKYTSVVLSGGNLTATTSASGQDACVRATAEPATAKSYWEYLVNSNGTPWGGVGVVDDGFDPTSATPFSTTSRVNSRFDGGGTYTDGSFNGSSPNAVAGDIIRVAYDKTNEKYYIALNDTWLDGADPSAGTGGMSVSFTGGSGKRYAYLFLREPDQSLTVNLGATAFAKPVPTGFSAYDPSGAAPTFVGKRLLEGGAGYRLLEAGAGYRLGEGGASITPVYLGPNWASRYKGTRAESALYKGTRILHP